jgi:hypothetical protein
LTAAERAIDEATTLLTTEFEAKIAAMAEDRAKAEVGRPPRSSPDGSQLLMFEPSALLCPYRSGFGRGSGWWRKNFRSSMSSARRSG